MKRYNTTQTKLTLHPEVQWCCPAGYIVQRLGGGSHSVNGNGNVDGNVGVSINVSVSVDGDVHVAEAELGALGLKCSLL
jgi:hypothetical protein